MEQLANAVCDAAHDEGWLAYDDEPDNATPRPPMPKKAGGIRQRRLLGCLRSSDMHSTLNVGELVNQVVD